MSAGMIDTLPPLREVIRAHDLRADKKLGQHFLLDLNITKKIARLAGDLTGKTVIEVGPGPGGLTRALLKSDAQRVVVIERDQRCIAALEELRAVDGRLEIHAADALKVDESAFLEAGEQAVIVANLPYNIGTALLMKWLDKLEHFSGMTLMLQKEVAERIAAQRGGKDYGRLAIMSQWLCKVQMLFDLSPEVFTPAPKVYSSVIRLTPREVRLAEADKGCLEKVCAAAFGQRRKMLRVSLKQLTNAPEALLEEAGISPTLRPEELDIAQFCALARGVAEDR